MRLKFKSKVIEDPYPHTSFMMFWVGSRKLYENIDDNY